VERETKNDDASNTAIKGIITLIPMTTQHRPYFGGTPSLTAECFQCEKKIIPSLLH
jgi:hypothetical protein